MGSKTTAMDIFDICDTKHINSEDFNTFYHRFKTTISKNLKKKGDKINDSEILMEDEIISPTFEDVIILWCLEKVDPSLPSLMKEKFSNVLKEQQALKNIDKLIFQEVTNLYNSSTKDANEHCDKNFKKENKNVTIIGTSSKDYFHRKMLLFSKDTQTVKRFSSYSKEIKQYVCNTCLKTFKEENDLKKHKAFHNIQHKDASKSLNYNFCDKKFNDATNLESHIFDNHSPLSNACMGNISDDAKDTAEIDKEINLHHLKEEPENVKNDFRKSSKINSDSLKSSKLKNSTVNKSDKYEHLKTKYSNGTSLADSNLKEEDKDRLKCKVCGESFLENRQLLTHKHEIHPKIYRKTKTDLSKNKKIAHIIREVKETREASNEEKKNIRVHCEVCGRLVKRIRYKTHLKSHQDNCNEEKKVRVPCEICGKRVKRVSYKSHLKTHEEKVFRCSTCSTNFSLKEEYETHMNDFHPGSIQPRKKVVCELCGKDFTATSLYAHIKICQTTKLKCTTCKRSFVGEKELKSHVCKHFSCNLCDQQFMMVRNLELHKLEHNGEEFFHCDFCEGLYRTRKQYLAHRRESHTNPRDKNHKCEKCDKEFINARQLRKHYRVHSNERPFKCVLCDAAFKAKFNLKIHIKTHGGEKLYSCDLCGKKFLNVGNMKHHKESKKCVDLPDEELKGSLNTE